MTEQLLPLLMIMLCQVQSQKNGICDVSIWNLLSLGALLVGVYLDDLGTILRVPLSALFAEDGPDRRVMGCEARLPQGRLHSLG